MSRLSFTTWMRAEPAPEAAFAACDPADLGTELGLEAHLGLLVAAPVRRSAASHGAMAEASRQEHVEEIFSHYGI